MNMNAALQSFMSLKFRKQKSEKERKSVFFEKYVREENQFPKILRNYENIIIIATVVAISNNNNFRSRVYIFLVRSKPII